MQKSKLLVVSILLLSSSTSAFAFTYPPNSEGIASKQPQPAMAPAVAQQPSSADKLSKWQALAFENRTAVSESFADDHPAQSYK